MDYLHVQADNPWYNYYLSNGINGKFYNSVKSMLSDTSACVKLNGMLTDWFPVSSGVRQGDSSSPTIFAFFVNDLICGVNYLNHDVTFCENKLCCLTYADDILLLAESENDMQDLLNFANEWCRKWQLMINFSKTNTMHFRNTGKRCSNFDFKVENQTVDYVSAYCYLGVYLKDIENLEIILVPLIMIISRGHTGQIKG